MQQEISTQARGEMDKSQREYYLRQQLRAIQQELGEGEELAEEVATYRRLVDEKGIPEDARTEIEKQIRRLERSHPDSAETGVLRTYLDWLTGLPWSSISEDDLDLVRARKILDEDHFDLEKIKERILEYLAVRKLKPDSKGPILCLVGPAGCRQDLAGSLDRSRHGTQVRPHLARRRARRGRDSRPPADLRRRAARPHRAGHPPGGDRQSGLHARRDRQAGRRLSRRSLLGAARGSRPGTELRPSATTISTSPIDLSRVLFITTANLLEPDPAGVARPHGGAPTVGLHRGREAGDRQAPRGSQATVGERSGTGAAGDRRPGVAPDHQSLHPRGGVAQSRTGDRDGLPQGRGAGRQRLRRSGRGASRQSVETPRPREASAGGIAAPGSSRHRHRPGVDRGRRRPPADRGAGGARQGRICCSPVNSARS